MSMGNLIQEFIDNPQRRNKKEGSLRLLNGVLYSWGTHFPLMLHLKMPAMMHVGNYLLINADRNSVSTNRHITWCNGAAGARGVAIPFSALNAAGIPAYDVRFSNALKDIQTRLQIIDKKDAIWQTRTKLVEGEMVEYQEHTLGASLIRYKQPALVVQRVKPQMMGNRTLLDDTQIAPEYKERWRYFLSGVDETGRGYRGTYFLTELKKSAKTVDEAFEQLKPMQVKAAQEAGIDVLRQGEYFFIKTPLPTHGKKKITKQFVLPIRNARTQRNSRNSSHIATEGFKAYRLVYVRGTIRHSRREHKMLRLGNQWYTAYINTQRNSFSADGGFD